MQTDQDQLNATDRDLVCSAKEGEMAAFEELVRRHTKRVFSIAYHITHSPQDAEEVSQETFLKAWCHLKDFEEKAQFSTWLTRIAVNTALCTLARSNRDAKIAANNESSWEPCCLAEEVADWRQNPEQLYAQSQLRQLLQQSLEKLAPAYSTVFLLRDIQGLTIAETAAALQLNVPVVKTRLLRARLQLRENLSNSFIPAWLKAGYAAERQPQLVRQA